MSDVRRKIEKLAKNNEDRSSVIAQAIVTNSLSTFSTPIVFCFLAQILYILSMKCRASLCQSTLKSERMTTYLEIIR